MMSAASIFIFLCLLLLSTTALSDPLVPKHAERVLNRASHTITRAVAGDDPVPTVAPVANASVEHCLRTSNHRAVPGPVPQQLPAEVNCLPASC